MPFGAVLDYEPVDAGGAVCDLSVLDQMVGALGGMRGDVASLSRARLVDAAGRVARVRGALDALEAAVVGAVESLDDRGAGAAAVLRAAGKCSQREADRRARRGAALTKMPRAADALAQGRLSAEHVDALAAASADTDPELVDNSKLLDQMAQRPADLAARDARDWARVNGAHDETASRHERQRSQRKASVFRDSESMTALFARWDDVTAAEITATINSEMNRLFQLDGGRGTADAVRTVEQRRADAVHNLICGIAEPDTTSTRRPVPRRRGPRHQIVVIADAGVMDGSKPDGRCELADGTPLPKQVLERFGCDSELFGLVFSGDGDPLWHGRGRRTASDAQLRALAARDRGCVSCGRSVQACEAHHVVPWSAPARGPTDIDNLVLLCSHHHHLVHDQGWQLRRAGPEPATGQPARWTLTPPRCPAG